MGSETIFGVGIGQLMQTLPLDVQLLLNGAHLQVPAHLIPPTLILHTAQIILPLPQPHLKQL